VSAAPIFELVDATVVRGGARVLDRVSLTVRPQEHTVILGANGAGKSSLIRVLTLEDHPLATGNGAPPLRFFGRARWDLFELRRHFGIVSPDLDATFAASSRRGRVAGLEAVVSAFLASHGIFAHQTVTEVMWHRARAALARVDALALADKPLTMMSAGEKRRVLIARALVTEPKALLLDEPTTGLDLVARHQFMQSVRRLAREGTTIVLVTHQVGEIIPEMRRVVLLKHGHVVHNGGPETALTPEQLSETFGAPLAVQRDDDYYHVRVR